MGCGCQKRSSPITVDQKPLETQALTKVVPQAAKPPRLPQIPQITKIVTIPPSYTATSGSSTCPICKVAMKKVSGTRDNKPFEYWQCLNATCLYIKKL